MDERRQIRLGLVGFGEVGSALARGLYDQGLERISVFSQFRSSSRPARKFSAGTAIAMVGSLAQLADAADVILAVMPGSASISVAEDLRPHLQPRHIYADLAAASPKVKQRVGEILTTTQAGLADGAIMTSPLDDGHRIVVLASGPAASAFHEGLVPWGMRIEVVSDALGTAACIKSLRTVFTKGMEALLVECLLASARYGMQEDVLRSIAQWMDSRPFMRMANHLVVTGAIHGARRAVEAGMSAEVLADVGLDPVMTRAAEQRLRWAAELGLRHHFHGVVPERSADVVMAIEEALQSRERQRE